MEHVESSLTARNRSRTRSGVPSPGRGTPPRCHKSVAPEAIVMRDCRDKFRSFPVERNRSFLMGLKHQSESDPNLARDHVAGEAVIRIQSAEHAQFGTISYELRRLWILHHAMARSGYIQLRKLHEQVLRLPIQSSNSRLLTTKDGPDLTLMIYAAGTQMVLNVVLTMQHFCQEIEACFDHQLQENGTSERIKEALS
jgi:hypothetical protein